MTDFKDRAIFGGVPAFSQPLHVGRPNVLRPARVLERLQSILESRWLTNDGPTVHEFERATASYLGVSHCVAVCNATLGLMLLCRALGLKGEVIVPSFTFVATAHALRWQGLTPVFCDIRRETHTLDPRCVEDCISPATSGIIPVHIWGRPCDIDELSGVAGRHGIELVFDASHSFGCSHNGRRIGGFGRAEVFSFHATKFVHTFEGGAITTNDGALAEKLRLMRNFGFDGYDTVVGLGINAKMNEICAAMGLCCLEDVSELAEVNRRNYLRYERRLRDVPGVDLLRSIESEENNFQYVVLLVDERTSGVARDALVSFLHAENVLARRYFYPGCHNMEPYRSELEDRQPHLPETDWVADRVMVLPTGTAVGAEEIDQICMLIEAAVLHNDEVRRAGAPGGADR
jgi:dTDP-4-amino-4,6-dideoxygalactose transaminase